jgi:hypothetical protein
MTEIRSARLRAYNVGFGDCLLLTLTYTDNDQRSVLIDFGSTRRVEGAPRSRMVDIATNITEETAGHLDMVVATHRHADHISGFGADESGDLIEALHPGVVVQPWTEAPDLATDAAAPGFALAPDHFALAATLDNMHDFALGARAEGLKLQQDNTFPKLAANRLAFLGETNVKNKAAVTRLMTMGSRNPRYAQFGDYLTDPELLPGVQIRVLGPPTLEQAPTIARQAHTDADQFWHLAGDWGRAAVNGDAGIIDFARAAGPLFPDAVVPVPKEAEWLVPRIRKAYVGNMMSLLRVMDGVLNNTSLILLVTIDDTKLLFPGDAQIENWSYALFDAPDSAAIMAELAGTNLYKVGHHGSLNATPKSLWQQFIHRSTRQDASDRLISVVSTMSGKHGNPDHRTEVPRKTLIAELETHSHLHSTQDQKDESDFWIDVDVPLT